ncbi:hypothetical protein ACFSTC_01955 [Nonomuraea ferruginea]
MLELGSALKDVPGLVILGHYGFERWEDGRTSAPPAARPGCRGPRRNCRCCSTRWA